MNIHTRTHQCQANGEAYVADVCVYTRVCMWMHVSARATCWREQLTLVVSTNFRVSVLVRLSRMRIWEALIVLSFRSLSVSSFIA